MTRSVGNSCFAPRYVIGPGGAARSRTRRASPPRSPAATRSDAISPFAALGPPGLFSGAPHWGGFALRQRAEARARGCAGARERPCGAFVDRKRDGPVHDQRGAAALLEQVAEELLREPFAAGGTVRRRRIRSARETALRRSRSRAAARTSSGPRAEKLRTSSTRRSPSSRLETNSSMASSLRPLGRTRAAVICELCTWMTSPFSERRRVRRKDTSSTTPCRVDSLRR